MTRRSVVRNARGYFGIVACNPKTGVNVGGLLRAAHVFGAAFVGTIGRRYQKEASDVTKAYRHIPLWHFTDEADFWAHIPYDCQPIVVEIHPRARPLPDYSHPERAVYILGPEDGSVPASLVARAVSIVQIPSQFCLNLAAAGSVVLYDRAAKSIPETAA